MKLKHLNKAGQWPSGNDRWYYRPKGQKGTALPDRPIDSPAFLAAYAAAAGLAHAPLPAARTGSIAAGVAAFLASDRYLSAAPSVRTIWRRVMDDVRTRYGTGMLKDLLPQHIRTDLSKLKPHPANNRLKAWRAAGKWWAEMGLVTTDPAAAVARRPIPASEGHVPWTEAEIARFRAHWPLESPQRLAFELLNWMGVRIADLTQLSEGMIDRDGWLTFRQGKTGGQVSIPLRCPAPEFSRPEGQAQLLAAIAARPQRHAVFMVTEYGRPRSVKAASAWFSAAARAAGVEGKSAHGLRKTRAMMMAERGATVHQLAAWLGHESLSEVQHYAQAADRRRILSGTDGEQPTHKVQLT